jgi:hypothetical protein
MPSVWIYSVQAARKLVALLFAAYNLVPLYGLWAWHWDAFQLLILYWSETVVLAAWTMLRLTFVPSALLGEIEINHEVQTATHASLIGFMSTVAAGFCGVHLFFLCATFSDDWFRRLHGVSEVLRAIYIDSGAWFPLALVTLAGGIDALIGEYRPPFVDALAQRLHIALPVPPPKAMPGEPVEHIVSTMFNRIIMMQVAIIGSAWLFRHWGSLGPLAIIVGIKTVWDFGHRAGLLTGELIEV